MKLRLAIMLVWLAASASVALGQARLGLHVVDENGQKVGYAERDPGSHLHRRASVRHRHGNHWIHP